MGQSKLKPFVVWGMVGAMTSCAPLMVRAGLEQTMERAFNAEINVTPADAYLGARRGAVSFGRVRIANKVSTPQLVTFIPPGIKAGCGGIDMWGGSFSFISGKQLESLAKNIASNAMGYAFELALSNFPDGKDAIAKIRSLVTWANKASIDSCTAAKRLVDGVMAVTEQKNAEAGVIASQNGAVKDFFEATFSGQSQLSKVSLSELIAKTGFKPNPIWSGIMDTGAYTWFPQGDVDLAKAMMSMTGAVVMQKNNANVDGDGNEYLKPMFHPPTITVDDLVQGGTVRLLECAYPCDDVSVVTKSLTGFYDRIYKVLAQPGGIIDKAYSGNTAYTTAEKQLLQNMKPNLGWAVAELSRNPGAAREYASVVAKVAAYNTACDLGREIFNGVEGAVMVGTEAGNKAVVAQLRSAKASLRESCMNAKDDMAATQNAVQLQRQFMDIIKQKT